MSAQDSSRGGRSYEQWIAFALAAWGAGAYLVAHFGLFELMPPSVSIAPLVVASVVAPVAVYFAHGPFRAYVRSVHPKHLTLFHLWRIPAGAAFLYYGDRGWLPEAFVRNAGYGDIAAGLLVPVVMMLPGERAKYVAFHAFGLLDFVVAVGTGLTFTLLRVPLMENIAAYPIVLIPAFGVGVSGASHVLALDGLLRGRGESRPANLPTDEEVARV